MALKIFLSKAYFELVQNDLWHCSKLLVMNYHYIHVHVLLVLAGDLQASFERQI